jgi:hypothetical protein
MRGHTEEVGDPDTTLSIVDGRVAMSADGDATLRLSWPDHTPLSGAETHATLKLSGEDFRAEVELTAEELDALGDAVSHARRRDENAE